MSKMVEHAERELRRAGLFDKDADYDGLVAKQVLSAVKHWSEVGHSGFSHQLALDLFNKLVGFKSLTPLTNSPDEWIDVSEESGKPTWQNVRDSSAFSEDGGKTYYLLDDLRDHYKCHGCGVSFTTRHMTRSVGERCSDRCAHIPERTKVGKTKEEATQPTQENVQ